MNLETIQQYSHRIVKVNIKNENTKSSYTYVTVKVHIDTPTNEVVRFSTTKNPQPDEWLSHQHFDNDYFLRIPNAISSTTEVYAHFFPAALYTYIEPKEIYSVYDFSDFLKTTQYNKWDGMEYPLQISSYGYEMLIGSDNKPLVRSLLKNSVSRYKDPNYKNYTTIQDVNSNTIEKDITEKGRFPLSSRYRNSLYMTAPDLEDKVNFKPPYWEKNDIKYSYGSTDTNSHYVEPNKTIEHGYSYNNPEQISNTYQKQYGDNNSYCDKNNVKVPYWEAKIHKSGLSPLISEQMRDGKDDNPINLYLNYQYLPTSTEYHQHYFGFEEYNVRKQDGTSINEDELPTAVATYTPNKDGIIQYDKEETERLKRQLHNYAANIKNGTYKQVTNKYDFEILDSEGLNDINTLFGEEKTYRLINHSNPFDGTNSFFLNHKNIYDINLEKTTVIKNCEWVKNTCEKDKPYWSYIPKGESSVSFDVSLKADTPYVLKYFIYIPIDAYIEDDSCYVEIQSRISEQKEIIGELPSIFKKQDKKTRQQWIYHEIPFYTNEITNKIYIKGPQHSYEDVIAIKKDDNTIISETAYDNLSEDEKNRYEIHDCGNDMIHFYSIQIAEMVEYSPTLKYTKHGVYLTEGDKYTKKSLPRTKSNTCSLDENEIYKNENIPVWQEKDPLRPVDRWINKGTTELPNPFSDIYIYFNDFDIIYNKLNGELSYIEGNYPFTFTKISSEVLEWLSDDDIVRLEYDKDTYPEDLAQISQKHIKYTEADENNPDINSELKVGELSLFNLQRKYFTTGINNELILRLQDAYGNPVTTGIVECSIWTNENEESPCADAERCLEIQKPDENGIIKYEKLNFRDFTPERDTYYLRVKYINSCYNKELIKWKQLFFVQERCNIELRGNISNKACIKNKETNKYPNECQLISKSEYDIDQHKYINTPLEEYTLHSVDTLPLRLDAEIKNQLGNKINEGYCELSINNKVVQTTFVDEENGIADFYLDEYDLDPDTQVVKVEYFLHPNESVNFTYGIINCSQVADKYGIKYDERPAIPISIRKLTSATTTQLTNQIYEVAKDDILFIDIDTANCSNFSITIQRNDNQEEVINITQPKEESYIITAMYGLSKYKNPEDRSHLNTHIREDNKEIDKYTIITGNQKDENGNDRNNKYRTTKKDFTIIWIDNT